MIFRVLVEQDWIIKAPTEEDMWEILDTVLPSDAYPNAIIDSERINVEID